MLVSIIVPNYNHEKYLVQRLESIFSQTYQNYEVILLDDYSSDNSREILSNFSKSAKVTHCIFNEVNSGNTFVQWIKGITLAKGDLIWIAETDDFCDNNFLEELVKPFQHNPEVVLAYCQSNRVNEHGEITGNWITHTNHLDADLFLRSFTMDGNKFIEKFLIDKNVIPNASAVIIRREAIIVEEHFDKTKEFKHCGDWMFYFKLVVNRKVAFIPESLNNFRYHSTSVIANMVQNDDPIMIIDISYKMRKIFMSYLTKKKVHNYLEIRRKNRFVKRNYLTYQKVFLLIRAGYKLRGYLLLLSVFDIFIENYKIHKKLLVKTKKLFS